MTLVPGQESPLQGGYRILRNALIVYAAASLLAALSAGLILVGLEAAARGDPASVGLRSSGASVLVVSLVVGATALLFFSEAFSRFKAVERTDAPKAAEALTKARHWYQIGLVLLLATAPLLLGLYTNAPFVAMAGIAVAAATAIAFLAAIVIPLLELSAPPGRLFGQIGMGIGLVAIVGDAVLAIRLLAGSPGDTTWLTFGGYPLVNWNVPLGVLVAGSSVLLLWAYRYLEPEEARRRSRPDAVPV